MGCPIIHIIFIQFKTNQKKPTIKFVFLILYYNKNKIMIKSQIKKIIFLTLFVAKIFSMESLQEEEECSSLNSETNTIARAITDPKLEKEKNCMNFEVQNDDLDLLGEENFEFANSDSEPLEEENFMNHFDDSIIQKISTKAQLKLIQKNSTKAPLKSTQQTSTQAPLKSTQQTSTKAPLKSKQENIDSTELESEKISTMKLPLRKEIPEIDLPLTLKEEIYMRCKLVKHTEETITVQYQLFDFYNETFRQFAYIKKDKFKSEQLTFDIKRICKPQYIKSIFQYKNIINKKQDDILYQMVSQGNFLESLVYKSCIAVQYQSFSFCNEIVKEFYSFEENKFEVKKSNYDINYLDFLLASKNIIPNIQDNIFDQILLIDSQIDKLIDKLQSGIMEQPIKEKERELRNAIQERELRIKSLYNSRYTTFNVYNYNSLNEILSSFEKDNNDEVEEFIDFSEKIQKKIDLEKYSFDEDITPIKNKRGTVLDFQDLLLVKESILVHEFLEVKKIFNNSINMRKRVSNLINDMESVESFDGIKVKDFLPYLNEYLLELFYFIENFQHHPICHKLNNFQPIVKNILSKNLLRKFYKKTTYEYTEKLEYYFVLYQSACVYLETLIIFEAMKNNLEEIVQYYKDGRNS
jgi:hypothetical protein